ncbi:U6 snRNA-associated Sm-like protein LSm4 [Penicillium macrosclerotiorum]|uniref:U6 snRNA-associated Sm-like protein LSm4 n=1 Tax=Penicillium macrosclerotiorum TaxID=303699 RepID=UPI002548C491|nr:U6 snRNA-associated Sm-like protein LSm4 [Penicillium macrosclerotiorum]KAJ5666740.1 U6 snRNA-associated Sm-like protein LSm4 [Penicillium macrosclerotiorum]
MEYVPYRLSDYRNDTGASPGLDISAHQFFRDQPPSQLLLPLGLLTAAQGHPMLVELKNGETLNGHLVTCDNWMNLILREVVQTSPEGDKFFRLPEVYIRGNNIKYLRVPEEIIEIVKEQQQNQPQNRRGGHGRDVNWRSTNTTHFESPDRTMAV